MTPQELKQKIKDLNAKQKTLDAEKIKLKTDFEQYLKDTNIPVYERWIVFVSADKTLKNHLPHIPPQPRPKVFDYWWKNGERHQTWKTSEMFEDYIDVEEGIFDPQLYNDDYVDDETIPKLEANDHFTTAEIQGQPMFALLEYILQNNIGSFTIDW